MRSRWRFVPLALLLLAAVEITVFVLVAQWIGVLWALLLAIAFTAAGLFLLGREGRRGWRRFRDAARGGTPAGREAAHGLTGVFAALLLIIPGFVSGITGLVLLIPPVRHLAAGRVQAATEKRVSPSMAGDLFGPRQVRVQRPPKPGTPEAASTPDEVIEGEIVD
ncbi:FxsA family protein [Hamadaea tsunoensis]|uniref:FxsA family protein n=1 Tax=Hamadaea tsunoensis TaxID=53368 RepID=UPI00041D7540|nr:FxsA family protein [Hamadaea tsunoensis]